MPRKKRASHKVVRPKYYSDKRLTVGMVEDLCREIKDKTASVMVGDKNAGSPDTAKSGMVLHRGNNAVGLLLLGGWEWGSNGIEDEEDNDEGDNANMRNVYDDDEDEAAAWAKYYEQKYGPHGYSSGSSCSVDTEPGDCVVPDGVTVKYLDELYDSPSKSNEVQQA